MLAHCLNSLRVLVSRISIGWLIAGFFAATASTATLNGQSDYATPYTFTTLAGTAFNGSYSSADGTGSAASFSAIHGVAVDSAGNVYVADSFSYTIRKITPGGVVTTLAGNPWQPAWADGTGSAALFDFPYGVAVDSAGNVYVGDAQNEAIRKITPGGVVTTLAGGPGASGSADGTGSAARFYYPYGVAVDSAGNVYVADTNDHTIRKVTSGGVVTTLAGTPRTEGSADGTGSAARFNFPTGVAVDNAGNVYVADLGNSTIRKVTSGGVVTTLAGSPGASGSADGTGNAARFYSPAGVAVDGTGNVYVADTSNNTIRKVTSDGVVTTLAGSSLSIGHADGTGSAALFYNPGGVAVDSAGNVYVADTNNHTIRWGNIAPPTVTSATSASGVYGQDFSYTATSSGALNYYTASGLPTGLSINPATGVISGTIEGNAGTYSVTLGAVNGAGPGSETLIRISQIGMRIANDVYT